MTFAWQGFQIQHPDDWAPAHISGNRSEGYVRIASPEALSLQIRWKNLPQGTKALGTLLPGYLNKLERDAKKAKVKFSKYMGGAEGGQYHYHWKGVGNGSGSLLWKNDRAFFVEISSLTNRSTSSQHDKIVSSFQCDADETELWSVFGLSVKLRAGMVVEKHTFQSGRTRVEWRDKIGRVVAERWGFGEQIMAKHPFEEWARESMSMSKAKVMEVEQGLELEIKKPLMRIYGLATLQAAQNQIVTLKTISRTDKGRPGWDWLT